MAFADSGTLYVNNAASANCSDSAADAGTRAQPYCSVQAAVNAAQPGDTVQVADGAYGPVDVKTSGTPSAPLTITGGGVISNFIPRIFVPNGSSGPSLTFDHVHNVVVSGFDIGETGAPTAVAVTGSSDVTLNGSRTGGSSQLSRPPAMVAVDGQSSRFTLSRSMVWADRSQTAVSLASGASGTVLTTNEFNYDGYTGQPAVSAVDAPGTVVVSNSFLSGGCNTAISLTGSSTGSTLENNAVELGTTNEGCFYGTGIPVVIGPAAVSGAKDDYNTVETASTGALYSWAGQSYTSLSAFQAATGQGAHDSSLRFTPGTTTRDQIQTPLIDSADTNAPDEFGTDLLGRDRVDDPVIPNTGTGVGYYDRGAAEYQDPYNLTATLSAAKLPTGATETVGVKASNPWNTQVTSYAFDFGDGSAPVVSTSPTASHVYTTTGGHNVTVTATMASGATHSGGAPLQVAAPAQLIPALTLSRQSGMTVLANAGNTTDAWNLANTTVNFGDGTIPVSFGPGTFTNHTYAKPGTYTATLTVVDADGQSAMVTQTISVGSALFPIGPVRSLDTRYGTGAPKAKVGPRGVVRLKVAGVNGVPATGITAVTLNLTALNATDSTWIAAYPDAAPVPTASNLNLTPGQVTPNLVTVPVSADGYIDLYNFTGSVDLVADVEDYYSTAIAAGAHGGFLATQAPARALDTRYGTGTLKGKVGPGGRVTFSVPTGSVFAASAVVLNVTETDATASSYIAVDQYGGQPTSSVLNFSAGQTSSNQVVVPLAPGTGSVTLYNNAGSTDLVADVQGLVTDEVAAQNGQGAPYFPVAPTRIVDTRTGLGAPKAPLGAKSHLVVKVAGVNGIPAGVNAVLVNLTGINPTAATYVSAYADGGTLPISSNLNQAAGTFRAVLALVPVGTDGSIDLYNNVGSTNIAADIEGYYTN
ncbi:PKD domain-containing protein [Streptacidiphilus sp. MAP12-16]|uniref:PKD domain-containing protein n=1 Tax=Streptacidiphilus sp. MAP12-16 TaxID=3156300 RepID=UPI0035136D36